MSGLKRTGPVSLIASAALMLGACSTSMPLVSKAEQGPGRARLIRLAESTSPANVVEPQPPPGSCQYRGRGLYSEPDPRCTPGALNPAVRGATIGSTICRKGWTATVRPPEWVTEPEKRASMAAYRNDAPLSDVEEDRDVPLAFGGAVNDSRNLWPEPGASPNPKDLLEDELNELVCERRLSLASARQAIVSDWAAAYWRYVR